MDHQPLHLTPTSIAALDDFVGLVDVTPFKRRLRKLLLYYLSEEAEELAPGDGRFVEDMGFLMELLDVVGDEQG